MTLHKDLNWNILEHNIQHTVLALSRVGIKADVTEAETMKRVLTMELPDSAEPDQILAIGVHVGQLLYAPTLY